MAIGVPDNFSYGGKKPNFERDQFNTLAEMRAYSPDFLDEGHISYCKEDGKHYKWNGTEWEEFSAKLSEDFINTISERVYRFNGMTSDSLGLDYSNRLKVTPNEIFFSRGRAKFYAMIAHELYPISAMVSGSMHGSYSIDDSPVVPPAVESYPIYYSDTYGFSRSDGRTLYINAPLPVGYGEEDSYYSYNSEYYKYVGGSLTQVSDYREYSFNFELDSMLDYKSYEDVAYVDKSFVDALGNVYVWDGEGLVEKTEDTPSISGTAISGKLNLADLNAVKAAQSGLQENEARFFVITDSQGKIPSKQKCYDVPSDVVRQMSLKTGNAIVDLALSSVDVEPIGVSVGDLIALTKVSVNLSDLAAAVGVSISLSGSMLIYQYKILHTNGAREAYYEEACSKGVYGLLSPWDKQMISGSSKPTRWGYGANLDDLLQSGVLGYTIATIGGNTRNWTIIVDCSASPDGEGFYHLTQTAICRDAEDLGGVYVRLGYYQRGGLPTFTPWRNVTSGGASGDVDLSEYAKKTDVAIAISQSITNVLNTEV